MNDDLFFIENGVRRRGESFSCLVCKVESIRRPNSSKKYCSVQCRGLAQDQRATIECYQCKIIFKRGRAKMLMSKHGFQFCSRKCKDTAQSLEGHCLEIRPTHYKNGIRSYRSKMTGKLSQGCVGCGETREFLLSVHHKDGDRGNNHSSNLEIVCGRCHAIRHLVEGTDGWTYKLSSLTPLDKVSELDEETRRLKGVLA